jgi:hypothetical protein
MTTVHTEQLDVVQGATFDYEFRWSLDVDGVVTPRPIGHMTAALQVRKSLKSPVLLEATTENGLIILGQGTEADDPETGRIRFLWSGDETMKIDVAKAVYDFELYDDHESPIRTYQLIRGSVSCILNVTRAEA